MDRTPVRHYPTFRGCGGGTKQVDVYEEIPLTVHPLGTKDHELGGSWAICAPLLLPLKTWSPVIDINQLISELNTRSKRVGKEYADKFFGSGGGLITPGKDSSRGESIRIN